MSIRELPGKSPRPRESEVLKACLDYLKLRQYLHWRSNNVPVYDRKRSLYRKFIGLRGVPDILIVLPPTGQLVGVECKRPGERATVEQEAFGERLRRAGGSWFVVHSLDELIEALEGLR